MKKTLLQIALAGLATVSSVAQAMTIEVESGVITPPFILTNGYILQSSETGLTNGGRAVIEFTITNAGDYVIQAWVKTLEGSTSSFFVSVGKEPEDPASIWEFAASASFVEKTVCLRGANDGNGRTVFKFEKGVHQLIVSGRAANAQLDRVAIVQLPPPPRIRGVVLF